MRVFLIVAFFGLSGCAGFGPIGVSFQGDFGTLSYRPPDTKTLKDK
jgi:hypothetical protein